MKSTRKKVGMTPGGRPYKSEIDKTSGKRKTTVYSGTAKRYEKVGKEKVYHGFGETAKSNVKKELRREPSQYSEPLVVASVKKGPTKARKPVDTGNYANAPWADNKAAQLKRGMNRKKKS